VLNPYISHQLQDGLMLM